MCNQNVKVKYQVLTNKKHCSSLIRILKCGTDKIFLGLIICPQSNPPEYEQVLSVVHSYEWVLCVYMPSATCESFTTPRLKKQCWSETVAP